MTSMEAVFDRHRGQHLNVEALTITQLEEAALEAGVPLEMFLDLGDRHNHQARHSIGIDEVNAAPHPNGTGWTFEKVREDVEAEDVEVVRPEVDCESSRSGGPGRMARPSRASS